MIRTFPPSPTPGNSLRRAFRPGVFNGEAPPTIINRISNAAFNQATFSPLAHGGGAIHGRIAGNVTNSIISVSVDPNPFLPNPRINNPGQFQNVTSKTFPFGAPNNIVLPRGVLSVKVEGTVNNSAIQQGRPSPTRSGFQDRRSIPTSPRPRRSSPSKVQRRAPAGHPAERSGSALSVSDALPHRAEISEGAFQEGQFGSSS